jgi:hypothetical protein
MHSTTTGSARFSLHLAAPALVPALAAPVLASHLGITESLAFRRLSHRPGPIARGLGQEAAQRLFSVLSALGLRLHLLPDGDRTAQFDVSVQLSVWADSRRAVARLAAVLSRDPADIAQALVRPGGLILPELSQPQLRALRDRLEPIRGLILLCSDREGGMSDLFATRPLAPDQHARLTEMLRMIGARPDRLTGACAAGLAPVMRDHLLTRLPDLGLIALDRGLQRFDLYLTGVTGWVTKDLADFLATRTGQPRARFEVISPADPVLLDSGLTHAVLRQFCADYAAIGLSTRPLLRGLTGFPKNPIL